MKVSDLRADLLGGKHRATGKRISPETHRRFTAVLEL
jgi:hypothetical protein